MEKKKFLKSAFMVLGTAVIVAGATYAVFHDTATVSGSTFSTGDSDLIKIKMPDEGCADWSDDCTGVSWSGLYPGWNRSYNLYLKNVSDAPIIIQTVPVIVETGSSQDLWNNTYMEIVCTGNVSTGRYSLSDWKNNVAVEIAPQLKQGEESGLCEVKFDVATSAGNEIASSIIGFNLVLNANQVGEGTVEPLCTSDSDCDDSNSETIDTCNAQGICEHQAAPPADDADADGFNSDVDCNDQNPDIYPGAEEVCDGKDNDCDLIIDDGNPGGGGSCDGEDADLCQEGTLTCTQGGILQCSDVSGDTVELCFDAIDNDCDGAVDEDCSFCIPTGSEICGDGIDQDCNGSDLACPLDLCVGVNCDDGNICTNDSCLNGSCIHTNNSSGCYSGSCGVMPGTCQSGSCVCTTPPTCTDSASCTDNNPCTDDTCFLGLQCQHSAKTCDDSNLWTHDACNPSTGACEYIPLPTLDLGFCIDLPWGGQWCNGQ